jgi:hypothetical protein
MIHVCNANLWDLLDEYQRLHTIWRSSSDEQDRRAMAAAWSIASTHPGGFGGQHASRPDRCQARLCEPTVLTCHWLPPEGEDYWTMKDHLGFRGACLGCGWVSDRTPRGRGAENLAVEDAHDHTHPGWREIPVVGAPPSLESPTSYRQLVTRWYQRWGCLLPEGWLDRGGPVRTTRSPMAGRHVPGRAPGGGYDLAADQDMRELEGGQLCLL